MKGSVGHQSTRTSKTARLDDSSFGSIRSGSSGTSDTSRASSNDQIVVNSLDVGSHENDQVQNLKWEWETDLERAGAP